MFFVIGIILCVIALVIAFVQSRDNRPGYNVTVVLLLMIGAFFILGSIFTLLWRVMP